MEKIGFFKELPHIKELDNHQTYNNLLEYDKFKFANIQTVVETNSPNTVLEFPEMPCSVKFEKKAFQVQNKNFSISMEHK